MIIEIITGYILCVIIMLILYILDEKIHPIKRQILMCVFSPIVFIFIFIIILLAPILRRL